MNDDDDFPLIDTDDLSPLVEPDDIPPPTEWQEIMLERLEKDILTGMAGQPSAPSPAPPIEPTADDKKREVLMEVASWFLVAEGKIIKVNAPETRLSMYDVSKVAKPMMVEHYARTEFAPIVQKHAGGIVRACIEGEPTDPRLAFGV